VAAACPVEVDQMDPPCARFYPAPCERHRVACPFDDRVIGALVEANSLLAEYVDCRDHFNVTLEPHGAMLTC
jgi:hypothetical protein